MASAKKHGLWCRHVAHPLEISNDILRPEAPVLFLKLLGLANCHWLVKVALYRLLSLWTHSSLGLESI
jgi:hypothetical protein